MGDTVQLSINGANNFYYEWTPALDINDITSNHPLVWPMNTQTYTVKGTSPDGCKASKQITINVFSEVFVPSAFTPNGDGLNDSWVIHGLQRYPGCVVTVFDRWGQIGYQSSGNNNPWNGRVKGQEPSTSTFVYSIDLKNGKKLSEQLL